MKVIKLGDKNYPKKLLNIYNPPKKLYILGNENILDDFAIGIVGSRICSKYGEEITKAFAYNLAKYNINIISGMAKGIDSAAHVGTIMAKGKTIAVLGSGFNYIYPKENKKLFCDIIKNDGAIVTEYDIDTKPMPKNFPERNRIIAGLSDGIVVTEAYRKSGSLITVDFALNEGKEVFAVPGNINSKISKGTNELIKQGAKLVDNVCDILQEYPYVVNKK